MGQVDGFGLMSICQRACAITISWSIFNKKMSRLVGIPLLMGYSEYKAYVFVTLDSKALILNGCLGIGNALELPKINSLNWSAMALLTSPIMHEAHTLQIDRACRHCYSKTGIIDSKTDPSGVMRWMNERYGAVDDEAHDLDVPWMRFWLSPMAMESLVYTCACVVRTLNQACTLHWCHPLDFSCSY